MRFWGAASHVDRPDSSYVGHSDYIMGILAFFDTYDKNLYRFKIYLRDAPNDTWIEMEYP